MFNKKSKPQEFNLNFPEFTEFMKEFKASQNNLKLILDKLYPLITIDSNFTMNYASGGYDLNLPTDVLRYVDDILGGKVIKQEGTKCIVIEADGTVKTGLTKQKADKGYSYKLVRS